MENGRKIYVAGDHIISALGFTTAENTEAVLRYESGIKQVNDADLFESPFQAARIDAGRLSREAARENLMDYSRLEQLFILSVGAVIRQTGIDLKNPECGLVIATTKGNIDLIGQQDAYLWTMAQRVAAHFGCVNSPVLISNACISGVSAVVTASRLIESGKYKHIIMTGGDLLTRFVATGFQSFKSVSAEPCKPYDVNRDGLTLGEACGSVVLTCDRSRVKTFPVVVVEGGGVTNDANHISGPSRTGDGLFYAIRSAMEETGLQAGDISFVNAHGTATPYNDEMESKALQLAELSATPLNSLKSYWGHTLGAAGIIESVACFEQLRWGMVWGTKGFTEAGVPCPVSVSALHRQVEMKRCIKTASGFGGCNAAVVYALEEYAGNKKPVGGVEMEVVGQCLIRDGKLMVDGECRVETENHFGEFIRTAFKALEQPNMKFYKMDDLSKLGYTAASWLLKDSQLESCHTGILLANAASSLDTDRKHQEIIDREGDSGASPAVFVYTLPNVVMGEICIRYKIQGENTFFIRERKSVRELQDYAGWLMQTRKLNICICGWCELDGENYEAEMMLLKAKR